MIRIFALSYFLVRTSSLRDSPIFTFILKIWQTDLGDVATLDGEDWSNVARPQHCDIGVGFCIPPSFLQLLSNCTILPERPKINQILDMKHKHHLFKYKLERKHAKTWVYNECFGHSLGSYMLIKTYVWRIIFIFV